MSRGMAQGFHKGSGRKVELLQRKMDTNKWYGNFKAQ